MIKTFTPEATIFTSRVVATIMSPEGLIEIYHCVHSGRVVTREKINTATKVFHPGIIIGEDIYNRMWVAHNHVENGRPMFELYSTFAKGNSLFWDNRSVKYSRDEIVERAIAEVRLGKTYTTLNYNCQTFVNIVVRNEHNSEAVDKIADAAMLTGVVTFILGLIFKNKAVMATGLGVTGIGGAAKGFSRIRF